MRELIIGQVDTLAINIEAIHNDIGMIQPIKQQELQDSVLLLSSL
jgi:hypothetical protein